MREPYSRKTAPTPKPHSKKQATAATPALSENGSLSVSKIQNGFLVHHSGEDKKGKYFHKTHYSPTNPVNIKPIKFGKK